MLPRVIPCLLLSDGGLVKTRRFQEPVYLGDPINIIKIFNDKGVDEVVLLDIAATRDARPPDSDFLLDLCSEAFMPVAYGGGISSIEQMRTLFLGGVEKIIVNTRAYQDPDLVRRASDEFGSQSVVVGIDVRRHWLGNQAVMSHGGRRRTGLTPIEAAVMAQERGAGELLLNSVDRDGTMKGYDLDLIHSVATAVDIPVVACGGAGHVGDLGAAVREGGASAVAAGSMFVFKGSHRAVLISFPDRPELERVFHR